MLRSLRVQFLFLGLVLFLSSCVPALQTVVQAPEFSISGEIEMISVELPIPLISSGQVVFRVPMDIYNPNAFDASVSRVDFDFVVNGQVAVIGSFSDGVYLTAQGRSSVPLDIVVPLENGLALVEDIANMLGGARTTVSLDGKVTLDALGLVQVYAKTRLLSGQIN